MTQIDDGAIKMQLLGLAIGHCANVGEDPIEYAKKMYDWVVGVKSKSASSKSVYDPSFAADSDIIARSYSGKILW